MARTLPHEPASRGQPRGVAIKIHALGYKATLKLKKSHTTNVLAYLRAAQQPLGNIVSAAPLETIHVDELCIINLPVYLASRKNIEALFDQTLNT